MHNRTTADASSMEEDAKPVITAAGRRVVRKSPAWEPAPKRTPALYTEMQPKSHHASAPSQPAGNHVPYAAAYSPKKRPDENLAWEALLSVCSDICA